MTERMLQVEGAIFLHRNLIDLQRAAIAVLVDPETLGVAEMLVDFGAGFARDCYQHNLLHYEAGAGGRGLGAGKTSLQSLAPSYSL